MTHLHHITLNTGHSRRSFRREVSEEVIELLRPVVRECETEGLSDLPSPAAGYQLRRIVERDRPSRRVAIWAIQDAEATSLATLALGMREPQAAGVWRSLHEIQERGVEVATSAEQRPPAPWLAVKLHLPLLLAGSPDWMGDLERCIAWTWIEEVYRD